MDLLTSKQSEALEALQQAQGNKTQAAAALGISRSSLRSRLAQATTKGPSGLLAASPVPQVAEGLELRAQTTHLNPDGTLRSRYDKTGLARQEEPLVDPVSQGHLISKVTTRIDADGRVGLQYVTSKPDQAIQEAAFLEAWRGHAELYRGLAKPKRPPKETRKELITIYPLGDPHIGLMSWWRETGENFDLKIGCEILLEGQKQLVQESPRSHTCLITNLGDFFHAQDDAQLTPGHGNKLDVDGRFAKVLEAGFVTLRGIIDFALTRHQIVIVRNLPGNHDPRVAVEIMLWLRAVYANEPRVVVQDAHAIHQYDLFGSCLFGWTHGDRGKMKDLGSIMFADWLPEWSAAKYRYWHTGHIHHQQVLELPGCVVESHRILAAPDAWHKGRYRSMRSSTAITCHRDYGERTRVTLPVEEIKAKIKERAA